MPTETIPEAASWYARTYPGTAWPCCHFVALVLRRAAGLATHPEFAGGGPWWAEVNVWDPKYPQSPAAAYARLVARMAGVVATPHYMDLGPGLAEVYIRSGEQWTWWVVQGWRPDGTGHQFLVHYRGDTAAHGDREGSVDVIESSEARGVRYNGVRWDGSNEPPAPPLLLGAVLAPYTKAIAMAPLWVDAVVSPFNPSEEAATPPQEGRMAIRIPSDVTEEVLDELKEAGRQAIVDAIAGLAQSSADGRVDAEDAGRVAVGVFSGLVDGIAAIADALLPFEEGSAPEVLSDLAIQQARDALKRESGPLDDLADAIVDAFDGPEADDIVGKVAKHALRVTKGKRSSVRRERKHARRLLKHFPEVAAFYGITGDYKDKASIVMGYSVREGEGGRAVLVPPRS